MGERIGDWFQTFTGRQFWPLDPRPEDLDIVDIAHALARICRFNGHVTEFYSVAQHSVLVSEEVERQLIKTHERLFARADAPVITARALDGLMHDAAEAYLGDMIRPLKISMPAYREAEQRLERVIAERFGLNFPWGPLIKEADDRLLMTERRDVLAVQREWLFRAEPLAEPIIMLAPADAEALFLQRFETLTACLRGEVRRG